MLATFPSANFDRISEFFHVHPLRRALCITLYLICFLGIWSCPLLAQETPQLVRQFELALRAGPRDQEEIAKKLLKNYREYQQLLEGGKVSSSTAEALDRQLTSMAKKSWTEVSKRFPNELTHVVQVGTFGTRNAPNAKYKVGISDKDFLPRGSKASEATKMFNEAFERQWGVPPGSVDINALDPTNVASWPGRKAAALNAEKYNTRGGINWLERDMYTQNPNVWELNPRGKIEEVPYRQVLPDPPQPMSQADALGFFSDNTRFREKWFDTASGGSLENLLEHQAKYDLRNVHAYGLGGGKLTKQETELIAATNLLRKGNKQAAIEWLKQVTGKPTSEAALATYLQGMNALNEKMGQHLVKNHIRQIASGQQSGELMNELAASLANLPQRYVRDVEKVALKDLGRSQWNEISRLSRAYQGELGRVRYGAEYFDEMARRYFGTSYNKLSAAEKAVLHNADEAIDSFATKAGRVLGASAVAGFGIFAIHDAYTKGASEGQGGEYQAFARACIEVVQYGYPPLVAAELAGRLVAGVTEVCASQYTQKQLDDLYGKLKDDPSRDINWLLNTFGADRYRAGALRQLALEIRAEHPGLEMSDALIDQRIQEYFRKRLATEYLQSQFAEFAGKAESWVRENDIPLLPGCDFISAFRENTRLQRERPEEYYALIGRLMSQYQSIRDSWVRENRPFTDTEIWHELYLIYRGGETEGEDEPIRVFVGRFFPETQNERLLTMKLQGKKVSVEMDPPADPAEFAPQPKTGESDSQDFSGILSAAKEAFEIFRIEGKWEGTFDPQSQTLRGTLLHIQGPRNEKRRTTGTFAGKLEGNQITLRFTENQSDGPVTRNTILIEQKK